MATDNQKKQRQKKRNSFAQSFLMLFLVMASLATDGFGIAQGSQLSQDFRTLISESFPIEFILPINQYLEELALATVPVKIAVDVAESALPETQDADLAALLAEGMVEAMLTAEGLATPQPTDTRQTSTALPSPIPSAIPSSTPTLLTTFTPSPIPTNTFVWYPWTSTPKPPTNQNPSCVGFNHSNPQTTGVVNIDLSTLCSDPDGNPWTITSVTQGTNGSSTFGASSINYDPNDGFAGTDNLTFTISDGKGGTYTQSFDVIISNLPPSTTTDTGTVLENSINNAFSILTNDSDPGNDAFTITNKTNGTNGTTEVPPGDTTITYRPTANFFGTDSFTYTVTDSHGGSTTETVNVTVIPPIVIYAAGLPQNGNMGGRAGANAYCAASVNTPTGYTSTYAFISVDVGDAIEDMPANFGIPTALSLESSGATLIANNWADLLDGTINTNLGLAGVLPFGVPWWSGSETDSGNVVVGTPRCSQWTQATGWGGNYGDSTQFGAGWMTDNQITCDQNHFLLCLATYP